MSFFSCAGTMESSNVSKNNLSGKAECLPASMSSWAAAMSDIVFEIREKAGGGDRTERWVLRSNSFEETDPAKFTVHVIKLSLGTFVYYDCTCRYKLNN